MKPQAFALVLVLLVLATPLDDLFAGVLEGTEDAVIALENNQFLPPARPAETRASAEQAPVPRTPSLADPNDSLLTSLRGGTAPGTIPARLAFLYVLMSLQR